MQCVEIYTLVIHVVPGSVSASTVTAGCCCCRRRRLPRAPEPIHHVEPSVAISALAYSVLCSAPVRFVSLSFHYFLSLLLSVILSFIRICFCFPLPYTPQPHSPLTTTNTTVCCVLVHFNALYANMFRHQSFLYCLIEKILDVYLLYLYCWKDILLSLISMKLDNILNNLLNYMNR